MVAVKTIVVLSGGLDSVVLLYQAARKHEVAGVLSFRYASRHNERELEQAKWHTGILGMVHRIVDLDFLGEFWQSSLLQGGLEIPDGHYEDGSMRSTVVPFRNAIFLSIACGYAESIGAEAVSMAAHAGDHAIYPDCREEFMLAMGDAMRVGTYAQICLLRPFIEKKKHEIVRLGSGFGVDFAHTWSCYRGGKVHCGTCGTCTERKEAFFLANVEDPTIYAS